MTKRSELLSYVVYAHRLECDAFLDSLTWAEVAHRMIMATNIAFRHIGKVEWHIPYQSDDPPHIQFKWGER